MTVSAALKSHAIDLFSGLGEISVRRMFGGAGLYCDGVMFALISSGDVIFLRAEGVVARALAAEGSEPFTYARRDGKTRQMGYWRLPDDSWDDPDEAMLWANRSLDLAKALRRA